MGVQLPPEYVEGQTVAGRALATMAEAVLVSAVTTEKLTVKAKKQAMNQCIAKLPEQGDSCGVNIQALMHAGLMDGVSKWILNN